MEIERAIRDLEQKRTETTSNLLECTTLTNTLAGERTDIAKERTALAREQTRFSTKSTELSGIRTEYFRERTALSSQRKDLTLLRTDFSRSRTSLAEQRTKMADTRSRFSEQRTNLAGTRTTFSSMPTAPARGRTCLTLIRNGLAFLSLSIAFFRIFAISWWSVFDGTLGIGSLVMTVVRLTGYMLATRTAKSLQSLVPME